MTARIFILIGAGVAAAGGLWWWCVRCERACAAAERDAEDLFERGELLAALTVIDRIDARCRCSRFTTGDAPPQYALAQTCLRRLRGEGRNAEAERLLTHARGPILKELARAE